MKRGGDRYPSTALQPMQVRFLLAYFNKPMFDGVEIEIDLV